MHHGEGQLMERDGQLELYRFVAAGLKRAHTRVAALQVTDEVRVQLSRRLLVITAAAKHDVAGAARRLDALMKDLDEGRFPDEGSL
jgi:hypothetical protein